MSANLSTTKDYLILKMSTNISYGPVVERLSDKPASVEQKYTKHLHYFSGEITLLNFSSLFIFQDRVKKWMDYTWSQQKSFDEHAMYELITCFHEFCNYRYTIFFSRNFIFVLSSSYGTKC